MKKICKVSSICALALTACMGLSGCGNKEMAIWSNNFDNGNEGTFGLYGEVVDNDNGTITLKRVGEQNYSASTYFGESDKNFDWNEGGMTVAYTVDVDTTMMTDGKYAVWSLALNEKDGKYLTELPVFFVGTENAVKFAFEFTGVETDYAAIAKNDKAATLTSGKYTVKYDFDVDKNKDVTVTVKLADKKGKEVYNSGAQKFTVIEPTLHEGKEYTSETIVKEDMVKGLRYLWLARTNVDVVLDMIEVTK